MAYRATATSFKGTINRRSESDSLIELPGDYAIVERDRPRLIVMRCPCGCGDDLLINLDVRSGPAWRFYKKATGNSLYPSYWRSSECKSHFIMWSDKIYWCTSGDEDATEGYWKIGEDIEQTILKVLVDRDYTHYIDLADECGLIPWECLQACRQLQYRGLCAGGSSKFRGYFKLA